MAYGDIDQPNFGFTEEELARSFPDAEYGSDKWNRFYEVKGQVAPSYSQMFNQTYDPAKGGDFFSQNPSYDDGSNLGGVAGFLRTHGYMVPLAAMAVGGGLAAAGAGAAGGAGAGGMDAYMASAGLNPGTFSGAAFTMPEIAAAPAYTSAADYMSQAGLDAGNFTSPAFTVADTAPAYTSMDDYMAKAGIDPNTGFTPNYASMNDYMSQAGLDAGTFSGSNFQMPSTFADLAKYASTASKALSTGSTLAKLLGGSGNSGSNKSSINPMQLGSLLAGGTPQTNSFLGQIKANQNPFIFTPAGQTTASEGMYDVSGSNMAKALRNA